MGKRSDYAQRIDITVCECGSEMFTCKDSRNYNGVRRRTKECLKCGKRIHTREIAEEEWETLCRFREKVTELLKEENDGRKHLV